MTPPMTAVEQSSMQSRADEAWRAGRYDSALSLYSMILRGQALTREAMLTALSRSAEAALRLNRAPEAMDSLSAWAQADPKARNTWAWNSLYVQALSATGREREATEHLLKLEQTRGAPYELTSQAAIELARHYAVAGQADQAIRVLRAGHAKAPSVGARAQYEANTARMLGTLDPNALRVFLGAVTATNAMTYPYNLIALEDLRRQAGANPAERGRLQELAGRLSQSSDLADKGLPGRILAMGPNNAASAIAEAPSLPAKDVLPVTPGSLGVALLLPQTGQLRVLAGKVLAGAEAAKATLAQQGVQLDLRVINSDAPDFADQLNALPPEVMLVGGPMHQSYFKNLPDSGELSRRIFLAFMPETPGVEEGRQVWRFFFSPEDEVNAILDIPIEAGISRFAVLSPEDRMGKRLAEAFSTAVTARNAQIVQSQSFPPNDPTRLQDIIKSMVRAAPQGPDAKTFVSHPNFDAIFIPDDLARAEQIIMQLRSFSADRLIILGPQLWAASISAQSKPAISPTNSRYAFCPGVWWPQSTSKALADLKARLAEAGKEAPAADFWSALGYDFVRIAAAVGPMPTTTEPSEVAARLNAASQKIDWILPPITWDASGHAAMHMFFFRPSVEGLVPVDKAGFKERLDALKAAPPESQAGQPQAGQPQTGQTQPQAPKLPPQAPKLPPQAWPAQ